MKEEFEFMNTVPMDLSKLPPEKTKTKFIELEVTKVMGSTIYLEIPESWGWGELHRSCKKAIIKECQKIDLCEWEELEEYEPHSMKEVDEKYAKQFPYSTVLF